MYIGSPQEWLATDEPLAICLLRLHQLIEGGSNLALGKRTLADYIDAQDSIEARLQAMLNLYNAIESIDIATGAKHNLDYIDSLRAYIDGRRRNILADGAID